MSAVSVLQLQTAQTHHREGSVLIVKINLVTKYTAPQITRLSGVQEAQEVIHPHQLRQEFLVVLQFLEALQICHLPTNLQTAKLSQILHHQIHQNVNCLKVLAAHLEVYRLLIIVTIPKLLDNMPQVESLQ